MSEAHAEIKGKKEERNY